MKQRYMERQELILTQDYVRFGGMQLRYTLSVRESDPSNCFVVGVDLDGERASAEAGDRLEVALDRYRQIVAGIVTPCTLEDVIHDFEYSGRNLRKKLYKRASL